MSGEDDRKRRKRRFGEDDDDKGTSGSGSGSGSGGAAPMKDNSDDKGEEQQQDTSTEPPQKKPTREEDMKARLNSLTASAALAANQSLQTVSTTQLQIMKEKEKTLVEMVIEATRFGMLKDLVNISLEYTGNVEERFDSEGPFWFTYKDEDFEEGESIKSFDEHKMSITRIDDKAMEFQMFFKGDENKQKSIRVTGFGESSEKFELKEPWYFDNTNGTPLATAFYNQGMMYVGFDETMDIYIANSDQTEVDLKEFSDTFITKAFGCNLEGSLVWLIGADGEYKPLILYIIDIKKKAILSSYHVEWLWNGGYPPKVCGFIPGTTQIVVTDVTQLKHQYSTAIYETVPEFKLLTTSQQKTPRYVNSSKDRMFVCTTGIWFVYSYRVGFFEFQTSREYEQQLLDNDNRENIHDTFTSMLPDGSLCITHERESDYSDSYDYSVVVYHPRFMKFVGK